MERHFINQLRDNEAVNEIFQITDKILRPNKNGILYLQFSLSDRTGSLSGRFWNATETLASQFSDGDYIRCEGTVQRFQGNLQFIVRKMTKVEPSQVNPDDFSHAVSLDIPGMLRHLREMLRTIKDPSLLNLADCFLADEDFLALFSKLPAGVKLHHAYEGGLLEHTLSVMDLAVQTSAIYGTKLNADLLLTGAFLHDVGKIRELGIEDGFIYTDEGQLLGHPFLAVEILEQKIRETETLTGEPFDPEKEMLLKHMLVSHHGTLENGSAKLPMTLEAITLYFLDSLDAKLAEFEKRMLEDPLGGSRWTNFIPQLNRKLYKKNFESM